MRKSVLLIPALIAVVGLSQAAAGSSTALLAITAPTGQLDAAATPEAAPIFKSKPILHRPNYTYYKADKKKKGIFRLLSFGK
ncbi:hypothetical protein [Hymenobacter sediminicola]|uniref:Uncharacterized protein n=1 Tax=Hymenobacter sediminicola TaxID=2761579 RepID=A0A7G7WBV6_9BACT|nr:hypothetical protein [Hymenobacter sediminicola]QNH63849.1 hypothetical protein H4317_08655 [Hymenobacter sediminicola]